MSYIQVNKNGIYFTSPFDLSTNYKQYSNSGYIIYPLFQYEWTGSNLTYIANQALPSTGNLTSLTIKNGSGELQLSISGVNYNMSQEASYSADALALAIKLAKLGVNQIYGGVNDDFLVAFYNGDYLDGGAGNDTLVLLDPASVFTFKN